MSASVNYEKFSNKVERITHRAYARVGLIGNPSDGFYGKTIALAISNFWAEVTIYESVKLKLQPHPRNDPTEFTNLADLHRISKKDGISLGGLRLLQATCKKFYAFCSTRGIPTDRNFTLEYDTTIPRQVGLAGSSAIVTATLKCLMEFFNLGVTDIPKELQPKFILDVEKEELKINAGLQDRVVQIYEGFVYMDFNEKLLNTQGFGNYEVLDARSFPHLWIAYTSIPSDSGKIHSSVYQRYHAGDKKVINAMKRFAELTDEAKVAIEKKNWAKLGSLMDANFDLRRKLYGDDVIGQRTIRMIQIGRNHGCSVKLPGSGGCVVGMSLNDNEMENLQNAYQNEGYTFVPVNPKLSAKKI